MFEMCPSCKGCGLIQYRYYSRTYTSPCNYCSGKGKLKMPVNLSDKFIIPKLTKTLKLQPKVAETLGSLIEYAQEYLNYQNEYTRIEFKYDRNYIIVAKLKENV